MISTVYIAKNVYGGDGLGRLGDGRVVFVPGAWAGEQVRAEIVEEKKHFVKARLVEVVEASPERESDGRARTPGGPLPGMVYEGLSYKGECQAKELQLREFFGRARIKVGEFKAGESSLSRDRNVASPLFSRDKNVASPLGMLNYRNKVVYHFARSGAPKGDATFLIGYRAEPSHEIVDITSDPLARPEINAELPAIRRSVLQLLTTGPDAVRRDTERKENVTIRWTKKTGVKWWIGDAPKDLVLKETTCGLDFEVSADGFYQVNPAVGEALVNAVVDEYVRGADAAPKILDLYCGVGVFGLCCLKRAPAGAQLIGIESGRQAIDCAKRNAENIFHLSSSPSQSPSSPPPPLPSTSSYRFFAERVGQNLRRIPVSPRTTVIVDPPRGGLEPGVAKWLANSRAARIFYVSCDPATLMRDLREITRKYEVESVRWFNMFPRTARFETLVVLKPRG